jgi:hypothetical protein
MDEPTPEDEIAALRDIISSRDDRLAMAESLLRRCIANRKGAWPDNPTPVEYEYLTGLNRG